MQKRFAVLILVAAAMLASAWVFPLEFQLDDYMEIAKAPVTFGLSERRVSFSGEYGPPISGVDPLHDYTKEQPLWRPVVWLALLLPERLQAAPLSAPYFRILPVLAHIAAVLLLWRLALRWLDAHAALAAALLFAVMPAGVQAFSWISACGDVFMTVSLLLCAHAMLRAQDRHGWGQLALWSATSVLALLCKESALPALALLAGFYVLLAAPRPRIQRVVDCILVHLPILLLLWWRASRTGSIGLTYQGMVGSSTTNVVASLGEVGELLSRLLVPWNHAAVYAGHEPWLGTATPYLATTLVAFLFLLAISAQLRRTLCWTLVWSVSLFVLALPVLMLLPTHEENSLSRAFYVLQLPCALLVGGWLHCAHKGRGAALAFSLLVLVQFSVLSHVAKTEELASLERARFLAVVKAAGANDPQSTTVVIGTPLKRGGIPFFTHLLPLACEEPFVSASQRVIHVRDEEDLRLSEVVYSAKGPVAVLDGRTGSAEVVATHAAIKHPLPELLQEPARRGTRRVFTPVQPLPLRAVRGLEFSIPPGTEKWLAVSVSSGAEERSFNLPLPESREQRSVSCALDDRLPGSGNVDRITISTASIASEGAKTSVLALESAPLLSHVSGMPSPQAKAGHVPLLALRQVPPAVHLRLEVNFVVSGMRLHQNWRWPPKAFHTTDDGTVHLDTTAVEPGGPWGDLSFANLRQRIEALTGPLTWTDVPCEWRLVAITPAADVQVARTRWQRFLLTRE